MGRRAFTALRGRRDLLSRWRRLSPAERRDFVVIAVLIPAAALAVRTAGIRRLHRAGAGSCAARLTPAERTRVEDSLARALARAVRYAPYRGRCLSQSLALWWLLRRRGVAADLRLGVDVRAHGFRAHAWVESDARVLNDDPEIGARFAPLPAI